jgi:hypothetical protein
MTIDSAVVDDLKADDLLLEPFRERLLKLVDEIGETEVRRLCDDDYALRRLLLARLNNIDKAYSMALDVLRWRSQIKPSELKVSDFATANSQACWRFAGYAKNKWPIILIKANCWDPAKYSLDEYVKMVAFFLERNEKRMNPADPEAKNYIVMDMKGMSYLKSDFRKIRQLVKLITAYFPERLGNCVVCNADTVTYWIWNIISPLIDKRTKSKVKFFRSNFHELLDQHIGLEHVGEHLGGTHADWPPLTEESEDGYKWTGVITRQETTKTEASDVSQLPEEIASC